jgi:hypothetical protein
MSNKISVGDTVWVNALDLSKNNPEEKYFLASGKVIDFKVERTLVPLGVSVDVKIKYHPKYVRQTGKYNANYGIKGVYQKDTNGVHLGALKANY